MQPCRVVSLIPRTLRGWSQQELAEFHRVGDILRQVGWGIETDQGFTDEGDPWFVFCDEGSGSVIAHFAKVNGRFVLASSVLDTPVEGTSFTNIVGRFLSQYPMVVSAPKASGSTLVFAHPVAALGGIVATLAAAQAIDRFEFTEARDDGREPTGLARSMAALADFVAGRTSSRADRSEPVVSKTDGAVVALAAVAFMHALVVLNDNPSPPAEATLATLSVPHHAEVALRDLVADNDGQAYDANRVDVSLDIDSRSGGEAVTPQPTFANVSPVLQVETAGEITVATLAAEALRFEAADIAFRWDRVLAEDLVDLRALGSVVDDAASVSNTSGHASEPAQAAPLATAEAVAGSSQLPPMALPDAFLAVFGQPETWHTEVTMLSPTSEAALRITALDAQPASVVTEPVPPASASTTPSVSSLADAAMANAITTLDAGLDLQKLLAFVSAAGPILMFVADQDVYLVDRDALGLANLSNVVALEIELADGATVHLIGMADVFATSQLFG